MPGRLSFVKSLAVMVPGYRVIPDVNRGVNRDFGHDFGCGAFGDRRAPMAWLALLLMLMMLMMPGPLFAASSLDGADTASGAAHNMTPNIEKEAAFIRALRLDRYDAFATSVEAFADVAGLLDIAGYLKGQNHSRSDARTILTTQPRQADQPFGNWVGALLTTYPQNSYQLLSALAEQYPYQTDEMRDALGRHLSQKLARRSAPIPVRPVHSVAPISVAPISVATNAMTETEGQPAEHAYLPLQQPETGVEGLPALTALTAPQATWPAAQAETGLMSASGLLSGADITGAATSLGFGSSAAVGAAGQVLQCN